MACSDVIRIGAVGVVIKLPVLECINDVGVIVDITGATNITVRFRKEDETVLPDVVGTIYAGGLLGDGRDGIVQYVTPVDFLVDGDEGKLEAMTIITFPNGSVLPSSIAKFSVKEIIEQPQP